MSRPLHLHALFLGYAFSLGGCCMGGGAVAPAMPAGPSGPTAPGCPDPATTIVGTWTRPGFVEEYTADGRYLLNGAAGTYRWIRPGHAALDVPSAGFHAEYDLGLSTSTTLLAVDPGGAGTVYTRTSPAPSIPEACLDLRAAFARTWIPRNGGPTETYSLDGTYAAPGVGRWSFSAPGTLRLVRDDGMTSDYLVAMPTATTMIAVSQPPLPPLGVAYDAAP